ncbi:MAG TPA: NAD(P)-dependent alcohol dehydrogenase [Anaerolineaceae bacterium]|nr:NAD(P)-dependent alcohol dehydrogenase [Anaerolineaceae bacterium]
MKAIVYEKYGGPEVLQLKEIEKPVPKDDEVLIKVRATSINSRDWRLMHAYPFFIRFMVGGLLTPKIGILGRDVAGWVEKTGANVRQFKSGDEVFGCLFRYEGKAFAEYACTAENEIMLKPSNITFEQAAAVPVAAMTALQGLRDKGNIQPGEKVLINGASGGVGTFAVQIAKIFGAEVTAVCSPRNLDMVRTIGADHVIDYTREDFSRNGQQYDLILAVNGYHPISDYLRVLKPDGTYIVAGGSMRQLSQAMLRKRISNGSRQRIDTVSQVRSKGDLAFLRELLITGKLAPVIDGCYPLEKTAEAFQYFENVHPRGKVVITVAE